MHSKNGDVIDHIDPKNSDLICGLDTQANKIVLDRTTNNRKNNRFVPYTVDSDIAVHQEFGDWGIFLIQDKWCWCEFGGPEWWAESKRLGFGATKSGKICAESKLGIHGRSAEQMSADGKKTGVLHAKNKTGVCGRSAEQMTANGKKGGKKSAAQKYQCLKTKHISTAAGLSNWQKARSIDTSLRIRRLDLEG